MRIPTLLSKAVQPAAAASLAKLLDESEMVKELVDHCAQELSSVNTTLKKEGSA